MRLTTPWAIIIGSLAASIIIVIGAGLIHESFWGALGAIGTILAVIWAVYHQGISEWFRKPMLKIDPYENKAPYLRSVPTGTPDNPITSYILTFQLRNTGESVAENAQPLLTRVWSIENNEWKQQRGWVPIQLRWVFDEISQQSTGKPTEERDLVQHRPYLFSLGELSTRHPETFDLQGLIFSRSQRDSYGPGQHIFEITAFSQSVDPVKKYIHLTWQGNCTDSFDEVSEKVNIRLSDSVPNCITSVCSGSQRPCAR